MSTLIDLFAYPQVQNALLAGSLVAIVAALVGYFLLVRGLTFAGHALPNIGFAGAAGAVWLHLDPLSGLFAFTMLAGVIIGLLGKQVRERDITIGILMTFALGLGLMFLALYSGYAELVYGILFGTVFGISPNDVWITAVTSLLCIIVLLALFRPLLFSSFDPEVAQARGVPVHLLAVLFMLLVAIVVSISVQVIGALLMFTLLIGPAATALRITSRPVLAIGLAALLGVSFVWGGVLLAAENGVLPVSFYIATIAFVVYLPVRLLSVFWIGRDARKYSSSSHSAVVPQEQVLGTTDNLH